MKGLVKYALAGLAAAIAAHVAFIQAAPRAAMGAAIARLGDQGVNRWRAAERITPASRTIVRPAPEFAYFACAYDLGAGPIRIAAGPWRDYWSLSLYAANSDNFFVIDDREARAGAEIVLIRAGRARPDTTALVRESPSRRGIALIRRLAPTPSAYAEAARAAEADVCAPLG